MAAASITTAVPVATDSASALPQLDAIPVPPTLSRALGVSTGIYPESESQPAPTSDLIEDESSKSDSRYLITSPYTTPEHLLDLSTLDTPNRLLAQALTTLTPTRADYATAPYAESFNWSSVSATLHDLAAKEGYSWKRQSFYVVVFRSTLQTDIDGERLHLLDERSHAEAVTSGGLLRYWFGVKNEKRENLATCVWRSREDARAGGTGPWHAKARGAARVMYEQIVFTTLELVVGEEVGEWEFREWKH
ncbi:uncharacterized protein DSM5745_06371 [Aspergillus mulundensis]|uniref:Uncharacterized protein n=1 Tax=Aspergillus mulundensis TaxID=1810919 RepID=A0A3D8RQP9_9EURO|nr:Uncharacterized protein DSM5745_06371 [Aspergillus mulundensis]RDW76379.1 Uncharacterized protein DSM5745_06371 [Aspergillus mulundensis]